jgi:hypothetical protein
MVSARAVDDARAAMVALKASNPMRPISRSVRPCVMAKSFLFVQL